MTPAAPGRPPGARGDTWIETPRLLLRRPRADDLAGYVRLHTDPRTYAHRPSTMPTPERCAERLERDLERWVTDDVGYAAVLAPADGALVGWAGLCVERGIGEPHLNLYFRLAHAVHGLGYGREIARALVTWAAEHHRELAVSAVVADVNAASLATCRSAGLVDVGTAELPDLVLPEGSEDRLLRAPTVEVVRDVDDLTKELMRELVDVWVRVNDAGGAVGFVRGTAAPVVRTALDEHLAEISTGRATLCLLRDANGPAA